MKRFLWLGFVLSFYVICSGCGETFPPDYLPESSTVSQPGGVSQRGIDQR